MTSSPADRDSHWDEATWDKATAVLQRYFQVRTDVNDCAIAAGRAADDVHILPVSKTVPAEILQAVLQQIRQLDEQESELYAAAKRDFSWLGENRVQAVAANAEAFAEAQVAPPQWSVIGPLQTNKATLLVDHASEFQALDRIKVARALQRRLKDTEHTLPVYLQVNTSGEEQKSGIAPAEVPEFVVELQSGEFPNLQLAGFMTMAMISDGTTAGDEAVRNCFEQLRALRDTVDKQLELSMGMSGDYPAAIAAGATVVRIGSTIFGKRITKTK